MPPEYSPEVLAAALRQIMPNAAPTDGQPSLTAPMPGAFSPLQYNPASPMDAALIGAGENPGAVRQAATDLGMGFTGSVTPTAGSRQALAGALGHAAPQDAALETARRNAVEMLGLPENNTQAMRARAMGYQTPAFHGTGTEFSEFDPSLGGSTSRHDSALGASFFAKDPRIAHMFVPTEVRGRSAIDERYLSKFRGLGAASIAQSGYGEGANVVPVLLRMEGAETIPNKSAREMILGRNGEDYRDAGSEFAQLMAEKSKSGDSVILAGHPSSKEVEFRTPNYVMTDPRNIRSLFASFDPARRNSADLLAQALLTAGVGSALFPPFGSGQ